MMKLEGISVLEWEAARSPKAFLDPNGYSALWLFSVKRQEDMEDGV